MKVSCICCTCGRYSMLRRSVTSWLSQDHDDSELFIFNTARHPVTLDASLEDRGVRIVNQTRSALTGEPYTSLGEIRHDSVVGLTGDVYISWDDDDLYLPWHIRQGVENLKACGRGAWMPAQSYFTGDGGRTFTLCGNSFEASVLVRAEHLRRYGFDIDKSGAEHLTWRSAMVYDGELSERDEVTPFESYAYIWGEPGHKISSEIDRPDNFARHQENSIDFGGGEPLVPLDRSELESFWVNIHRSCPDPRLADRLNGYLSVGKRL